MVPAVYEQDLDQLLAAAGDRAYRERVGRSLGWWTRWRTRRQTAALRTTGSGRLFDDLAVVARVAAGWLERGQARPPVVADPAAVDVTALAATDAQAQPPLTELSGLLGVDLAGLAWAEFGQRL